MGPLQTISGPWLGKSGVVNAGLRGFEKCLGTSQESSLKHDHACENRLTQAGEIFRLIFIAVPEYLVRFATAKIAEVRRLADRS